jgi:hypothetical protein
MAKGGGFHFRPTSPVKLGRHQRRGVWPGEMSTLQWLQLTTQLTTVVPTGAVSFLEACSLPTSCLPSPRMPEKPLVWSTGLGGGTTVPLTS